MLLPVRVLGQIGRVIECESWYEVAPDGWVPEVPARGSYTLGGWLYDDDDNEIAEMAVLVTEGYEAAGYAEFDLCFLRWVTVDGKELEPVEFERYWR